MVDPGSRVMAALVHRVPLTLIMDLAHPTGPDSQEILAREPADTDWIVLAFPGGAAAVNDPVAG